MCGLNHLPIWGDASRLFLAIEQAVRPFPPYHEYRPEPSHDGRPWAPAV
jgi:hypothetical protein